MNIILFGISNVGKTCVGRALAQKLDYPFYDTYEEIKKTFQMTFTQFMDIYPDDDQRHEIKGKILKELTERSTNSVIAAPIFNGSQFFESLLESENIFPILLKDTPEHILERLVFTDENDNEYKDDEYVQKHRDDYYYEIIADIYYYEHVYENIKSRYFMNNKSVEQCAQELADMITHHVPIRYLIPLEDIVTEILESWQERICHYNIITGHKVYINNFHLNIYDVEEIYMNQEIFLQVPTLDDFLNSGIYEDFAKSIQDIQIRKSVMENLDDIDYDFDSDMENIGLMDDWLDYQSKALESFAIKWCEENHLEYQNDEL